MTDDEVYSRAPLAEVDFEMRFAGNLEIECNMNIFQSKIKADFPNLSVPIRDFSPLSPYRFDDNNQLNGVLIAINTFAFYTKQYCGFNKFQNDCSKMINTFNNTYKIAEFNRLGLRYNNVIDFISEDEYLPVSEYLKLGKLLPRDFDEYLETFDFNLVIPLNKDKIKISINAMPKQSKYGKINLDFDYFRFGVITADEIEQFMKNAHSKIKELFEDLMTDQYRAFLQSED